MTTGPWYSGTLGVLKVRKLKLLWATVQFLLSNLFLWVFHCGGWRLYISFVGTGLRERHDCAFTEVTGDLQNQQRDRWEMTGPKLIPWGVRYHPTLTDFYLLWKDPLRSAQLG